MKENNKGVIVLLIVIIVMLVALCVLFATGTISLNVNSTNNNESSNNQQNINYDKTIDNATTNKTDYDADAIAKEKMPIAVVIANQTKIGSTYCGNFDYSDQITVDTDVEYVKVIMDASSKFKTLNELKEYLAKNLSSDLINKYFKTKENSYLEKDGKLYCQSSHKGIEWISVANETDVNGKNPITYTILNKTENSFDVKIDAKYGLMGEEERNQLVTINATIVKENGNWLVSKYEQ